MKIIIFSILILFSSNLFAWDDHALYTYPVLEKLSGMEKKIRVESLESFLNAEKSGLAEVLDQIEDWAVSNISRYPVSPAKITFRQGTEKNIRVRFLKAIRVNPEYPDCYYLREIPGIPPGKEKILNFLEVSVYDILLQRKNLVRIRPEDSVSLANIISSASSEPDFGLDINLWENNGKDFDSELGWGKQPFGNPKVPFGTMPPFHMGLYHESGLLYSAVPYLKKCYPEYRATQFLILAKFAHKTGHDYWAARFAGWGLHYVQDLVQPYHAKLAPGISDFKLIYASILDIFGKHELKTRILNHISDFHFFLEQLARQEMIQILEKKNYTNRLVLSLQNDSKDFEYGSYYLKMPSGKISSDSAGLGLRTEKILSGLIGDSALFAKLGQDYTSVSNYFAITWGVPDKNIEEYEILLSELMHRYGSATRVYLKEYLKN